LIPPVPQFQIAAVQPGANNVTVLVNLQQKYATAPLTIFCFVSRVAKGPPVSLGQIRSGGVAASFDPIYSYPNVSVTVGGLNALQAYRLFCYLQMSNGLSSALTDAISNAVSFNTTCCKAVTFTNAPASVYGDVSLYKSAAQSSYVFTFALESAPTVGAVTIVPQIVLGNGKWPTTLGQMVNATPSALTFQATNQIQLTGQFFLSALPKVKGPYRVNLLVKGSAGAQYATGVSTAVTIVANDQPLPAPALVGAVFSDSGAYIAISFSVPTDQAGITANKWMCDTLFTFMGASIASCSWADLMTVRAYPSPFSTNPNTPGRAVQPGDSFSVVGGKVRSQCRYGTTCTNNVATAAVRTTVQPPVNPLVPNAVLNVPSSIGACSDLNVDLSSSTGSGGRRGRGGSRGGFFGFTGK
jgi:hypothetical protein